MHYFADKLQAGPLARTYMLGYEQMMRKKSIKSRKYRGHSSSKRQNILIFHQNSLQHPISSLSASHVIIYCARANLEKINKPQKVCKVIPARKRLERFRHFHN